MTQQFPVEKFSGFSPGLRKGFDEKTCRWKTYAANGQVAFITSRGSLHALPCLSNERYLKNRKKGITCSKNNK